MIVLDGKRVAEHFKELTKKRADAFRSSYGIRPGLAVILVGDNPASVVYVNNKEKACETVGIDSFRYDLKSSDQPQALYGLIEKLNKDKQIHGILVQMPVPVGFDFEKVLALINPFKDADGMTYENMGFSWAGKARVKSCTPQGVIEILKYYKIPMKGQNAVVIGRSNIVGKPMAQYLLDENATVTICHSQTKNLSEITRQADILIAAAGRPQFIGKKDIKQGAVVIDVGIHRQENGKLCGDVKFQELEGWASAVTPVPGGVGPMTIAMLMKNTIDLAELSVKGYDL